MVIPSANQGIPLSSPSGCCCRVPRNFGLMRRLTDTSSQTTTEETTRASHLGNDRWVRASRVLNRKGADPLAVPCVRPGGYGAASWRNDEDQVRGNCGQNCGHHVKVSIRDLRGLTLFLASLSHFLWSRRWDSNPQPAVYKFVEPLFVRVLTSSDHPENRAVTGKFQQNSSLEFAAVQLIKSRTAVKTAVKLRA